MKRTIAILSIGFTAFAASAQQTADIHVSYDSKGRNWTTDSIETTLMSLLANAGQAKYFNDISLWNDSLNSTPKGKAELRKIIMATCMTQNPDGSVTFDMRKGPVKKVNTYVFTDLGGNSLRYYSKFGDEQGYYDEPFDEMQWEITDSTTNILGYECIMATTDYHGRRWTAWFTPDVPVPFGPWKLRGLPGLILKATTDNDRSFVATGLEKSDRRITPMYSPEEYQKKDRKKALSEHEYFKNNSESILRAKFGNVQFSDEYSNRPKYDAARYADEPDYKMK